MSERELTPQTAAELFGKPEPPAAQAAESSDEEPEPTVDPLVAHLQAQARHREALTQHLLAPRPAPEPTGEDVIAFAQRKREEQRDLIERLHGDAEQTRSGLPPIRTPQLDLREPLEPSGEPRPEEFEPPFPPCEAPGDRGETPDASDVDPRSSPPRKKIDRGGRS